MNHREQIWQIVLEIPKGKVATYGQIANLAGLPGYARYVGYTMRILPDETKLPWHRVVNSKGSISFKAGTKPYLLQKSLLEEEGIVFIKGKFSLKKYGWKNYSE